MNICNIAYTILSVNLSVQPLTYSINQPYGNYCGINHPAGSDNYLAYDEVDACCYTHDKCNIFSPRCNRDFINCVIDLDSRSLSLPTLYQQARMILLFMRANQMVADYLGRTLVYSNSTEFEQFVSVICDDSGHFKNATRHDANTMVYTAWQSVLDDNGLYLMLMVASLCIIYHYKVLALVLLSTLVSLMIWNIILVNYFIYALLAV
jgi:hypothetical protein